MAERLRQDPYAEDPSEYSIIEPDDEGGWRISHKGQPSYFHIDEAKVIQRAAVLVCLGGVDPV